MGTGLIGRSDYLRARYELDDAACRLAELHAE